MKGCFHWLERKGRMSKTNLTKKENFYREYDGHDEYRLIIDVVDLDECCDIDPIGLCTPEYCMSCKNARIKLIRTDGDASMMNKISTKFDKYPRHFLTTHKIACRNYNRLKEIFDEQSYQQRINKEYECQIGNYCFIYPQSTNEIKEEAVRQNNCVASYIKRVINGECHILFLRRKNALDESLVTIEVRDNKIVQAKRKFNDPVTKEDQEAIDKWNKKFSKREEKAACLKGTK